MEKGILIEFWKKYEENITKELIEARLCDIIRLGVWPYYPNNMKKAFDEQ